jgi:hypothetical protein
LFVGQVKVHDPHMGVLTFPAESAERAQERCMRGRPVRLHNWRLRSHWDIAGTERHGEAK